ncbi:MAG: hypothetical protein HKN46_06060 [Acidimicrobiia bacterium]|nr:hypothetical protein [Acidimicrobiia bacterium]
MPIRTLFFFVLLAAALALVGFPEQAVPVPDAIGTSRDWEDPANEDLFETVAHNPRDTGGYGDTVYAELGKKNFAP